MSLAVEFIPTPDRVIQEMLNIAQVRKSDVVIDLGCGDGRISIEAARRGARAIGVDLDEALVGHAIAAADAAGLSHRASFQVADLFTVDVSDASVVSLYLLDSINVLLRPRLLRECRPGTRIVTYSFEMGDWECDEHIPIAANGVSLWYVPADFSGTWRSTSGVRIRVDQRYQKLTVSREDSGESRDLVARGYQVHDEAHAKLGQLQGGTLQLLLGAEILTFERQ